MQAQCRQSSSCASPLASAKGKTPQDSMSTATPVGEPSRSHPARAVSGSPECLTNASTSPGRHKDRGPIATSAVPRAAPTAVAAVVSMSSVIFKAPLEMDSRTASWIFGSSSRTSERARFTRSPVPRSPGILPTAMAGLRMPPNAMSFSELLCSFMLPVGLLSPRR